LFVDHTREFFGFFPRITSINHYACIISSLIAGISVQSSIASASLTSTNNGTIDTSGSISINQHFILNGLPVVRTDNYRGAFRFNNLAGYTNIQFNKV